MNVLKCFFRPLAIASSLRFCWLAFLLSPQFLRPAFAAGSVSAWGDNSALQSQVPPGLTSVSEVAAGGSHSLALKSDGSVQAWGLNVFGQATVPPGLSNVIAIAAGNSFSMALQGGGTVTVWGNQAQPPAGLTNILAIAAGFDHCLALSGDGSVSAWGTQSNVPPGLSNIVAIAAGYGQSLALSADGTITAWGDNSFGKATVPSGLAAVAAIAAGQDHSMALRRNGTVVAWGDNSRGQTNVPAGLTNVVSIAAGGLHNLALRANGTLAGWGDNTFNQSTVSTASNYFGISAGAYHSLAVRGDGSPVFLVSPASQTAVVSKSATFYSMAAGAQPITFRWRHNGTNLPNATGTTLTITNVQLSDAGAYTVAATNSVGWAISDAGILTPIGLVPFVTSAPQDQTTFCGDGAIFHVSADGSAPFKYQWQFEGVDIPGATRTTLTLTNVPSSGAGRYYAVVTNAFGSITSPPAFLTVQIEPPFITSPLLANAKQGQPFNYVIRGIHTPVLFGAAGLPLGLSLDPATGVISGIPTENGTFGPTISEANSCASDVQTLVINIASSVPVITSALSVGGGEGTPFAYTIQATDNPDSFGANNLPVGLTLDPATGFITGTPVYAGNFSSLISASNQWGVGTATLQFAFTNALLGPDGLLITDLTTNYSSPYLLDFQFSLKDNTNDITLANPVVVDPRLLSVTCLENGVPISTNETAALITRGSARQYKTYLALDFTESIATLANGDTNQDGISDAVDAMVAGAQDFVNQQPPGAQVGVYEFHREDQDPQSVIALTTDKLLLNQSIAGIWTNYVRGFPAGSRTWDALYAAIGSFGPTNRDEDHYLVFVSDGKDESSAAGVADVITAAIAKGVRIYCIGFGAELDPVNLQAITAATAGHYYDALAVGGLTAAFDQVGRNLNGQYLVRWGTLKRGTNSFMPSFQVMFQGQIGYSPTNPIIPGTTNIDNSTTPPTTNITADVTNFLISPYIPAQHTGNVTVGALRLVANAAVLPRSVTLRAVYVPRYVRQMRIHYRANWPCVPSLLSTNQGEILYGWSLGETNDGAGGKWLQINSSNPQSLTTSIPFAALGELIQFDFRDMLGSSNAFSSFAIDNTIYTNTGNQSFTLDSTNVLTFYSNLPYATPVPWLIAHGFTNNFAAAELSDPDGDGVPTWQEYQANTDPRDPNSAFVVHTLTQALDGRYQVSFRTSLNRSYRVESSLDLLNWQLLQANIPGTGGDVTFTDTRYLPGVTRIFYRVGVN